MKIVDNDLIARITMLEREVAQLRCRVEKN